MTEVQKRILDIFKTVSAICNDNGIPYYAIGGTCIGAVRHRGFIPWDDDLDIAVPIESFDKLRECLKASLPQHLKVYDCDSVQQYHYVFMKVEDIRTTFLQKTIIQYPDAYMGVYVDIMPMSGIPTEPKERRSFINRIKLYQILNVVRRFPLCKQNSKSGKIASALLKLPLSPFRFNYFSDKYMELLRQHPLCKAAEVGDVWTPQVAGKWRFPKEWFSDTIELPFEDTVIKCPINYLGYLSGQFGDYMTPPPVEQRTAPHDGFVDLEHPYSEYQNGIRKIVI